RFLGELTGRAVGDRLAGTMGSVVACALLGAGIIRVHDVKAARDALNVALAVMNHKPPRPDEED
ncbi:MAG TPA: dihydropteroate synthase, partial [Candidatus Sumerlaeota bacterium]|nr:dihydropteroate synthase [Candidatus Sumerlaeota bacterium]